MVYLPAWNSWMVAFYGKLVGKYTTQGCWVWSKAGQGNVLKDVNPQIRDPPHPNFPWHVEKNLGMWEDRAVLNLIYGCRLYRQSR